MMLPSDAHLAKLEAVRIRRDRRAKQCSVYVIFAKDADGPMYVKVGFSSNPGARLKGIQTGCPILIRRMLAFTCQSHAVARATEQAFHGALESHRTVGEWFKIEWDDGAKQALHQLIEQVMDASRGGDLREVSVEDGKAETAKRKKKVEDALTRAKMEAINKHRVSILHRAPLGNT